MRKWLSDYTPRFVGFVWTWYKFEEHGYYSFGAIAMRWAKPLVEFVLVSATLANFAPKAALACDANANCRIQECTSATKCVEVIDKVCEAHRAACIAFPPPARNPPPTAGRNPPPPPAAPKQVTQQRPTTSPRRISILETLGSQQKEQFVNLVANEWLVKTATNPDVQVTEKILQETLMGAATQMPNLTGDEKVAIVNEVLQNKKEFSEIRAATNAVLDSLTEGSQSSSANSTPDKIGADANHTRPFPCFRGKCD